MKEFKTELDKFLLDNLYLKIDIYPLIKSHNGGQNAIKSSIQNIVSTYKSEGLITIDDESFGNLYWVPPTAYELPDREIFVTAGHKFEQTNKTVNVQPSQITNNHFNTYGDHSPIAGRDLNIGDNQSSRFDFKDPIAMPMNTEISTQIKKSSWLKQTWEYISNNALIAGIIAAVVAAFILLIIFGHF
jgi:hypothetical protein